MSAPAAIRIAAARGAAKHGGPGLTPILVRLLADADLSVRIEAIAAVAAAPKVDEKSLLARSFASDLPEERAAALRALAKTGTLPEPADRWTVETEPMVVRIAAVESLASGRPVIGLRSGGVLETVQEGVTGTFYDDGDDPRALAATVAGFDPAAVDPDACVTSAQRFGIERFQERLRAIVDEAVAHGGAAPISERVAGGLLPRRSPRRGAESMRIR